MPRTPLLLLALSSTLVLTACGADAGGSPAGTTGGAEEPLTVVASFYPVQYVVERVAGDAAEVSTLTRPGVDPHDVELSPREVGGLGSADLVVYSAGMQPAVDRAVETQAQGHAFDVSVAADLTVLGETQDDHAGHGDDGHDHGGEDPHFWLDPERYADVAEAVAEQLVALAPDRATDIEARTAAFVSDLEDLDDDFEAGLASCESRDLVTTHEAFGYLAERYDLHQTGITGLTPESEPSAARLAEITEQVREQGITAIYAEPLLSDAIARTVAQETGARVLVLDPADGLTEASAGDYLDIMRANLEALRDGLGCS